MDYKSANDQLQGRNSQSRKLANNTYLQRRGDDIVVMLHVTDIVIFKPDGTIVLDSGGWRTPTTKERMNDHVSVRIYQAQGVWYVSKNGKSVVFQDKMVIGPRGGLTGGGGREEKRLIKLSKDINAYAKGFVQAIIDLEVDEPSGGDCWFCCMKSEDGKTMGDGNAEHLLEHMREKYYVPSLLMNAVEFKNVAPIVKGMLHEAIWMKKAPSEWSISILRDHVKSSIVRYMKHHLNIAQ
jgi:hypothetical protein